MHTHTVIVLFHFRTNFNKFRCDSFQMLGNDIADINISACRCCRDHIRSGFDLIRNDRIFTSMQTFYPANTNRVSTGTFDIGSHAVQEVGNIYDMRLFCRILDNCLSFCHTRRHHNIDCRTYTWTIQINMTSDQRLCIRINLSIMNRHGCAKLLKSFEMLVDRTASDLASTRKGYDRFFIFSEKCAYKIVGTTDLTDIFVIDIDIINDSPVDTDCMLIYSFYNCSNSLNGIEQYFYIIYLRKIFDQNRLVCHNCGNDDTQCCIFRTADLNFSL